MRQGCATSQGQGQTTHALFTSIQTCYRTIGTSNKAPRRYGAQYIAVARQTNSPNTHTHTHTYTHAVQRHNKNAPKLHGKASDEHVARVVNDAIKPWRRCLLARTDAETNHSSLTYLACSLLRCTLWIDFFHFTRQHVHT